MATPKEKKKRSAARVDANALQYSKQMSKFICWVWALYRFGVLIVCAVEPDASAALATTLANLDWIMLVNEGTYLINSLGEKYIYSDKFILKWISKGGVDKMLERLNIVESAIKTQDEQVDEELEEIELEVDGGESDGEYNNG